ncbi:transketolase family protein [Candidatus Berkelbacteria bacterium]|nr:transketolase family protein [Candidatus Berkelbacteria bacterium]
MTVAQTLNPNRASQSVERRATRDGFGEGLVLAGEADSQVVVLAADLAGSTRAQAFAERFPDRFVQVGVAEQNLVTVASGLAAAGKRPVAVSYAVFSPGRNWEQIRTTICYNDQPVVLVGSHAGISVGADGATHQALEDLALARVLPNLAVLSPCDAVEARKAIQAALRYPAPVYLRLTRPPTPVITTDQTPFTFGQALVVRPGDDVTIIGTGPVLYEALLAADQLHEQGMSARVLNVHTLKPLDTQTVLAAARETGAIVTVEDHQIVGGLGGAVAEYLAATWPTPLEFVGMQDQFGQSGSPDELAAHFGLTAPDIVHAALRVRRRANRPKGRAA